MRGGMYNGIKNVSLENFEKPVLKENSLVVKNLRAGICGTDIGAYLRGGDAVGIFPGNQFGHEMVGVIEEIAEGVEGFEKGKTVFVNPTEAREIPEGWNKTMSVDMAGAFSEYILIENPRWGVNLFEIPENVSLESAAIIEPMCVAMNGVVSARPVKGERAIVYGAGPIGLAAMVELKSMGVEEVIVADAIPLRLEAVEKLGGIACDVTKTPINESAMNLWGSHTGDLGQPITDADIVIDCAGYPDSIKDFMTCAKLFSRYVAIALGMTQEPISTFDLVLHRVQLIGSSAYTPEIIQKVIDLLATGVDVSPIITDVYGLTDISKAFEEAAKSAENIKVLIDHTK